MLSLTFIFYRYLLFIKIFSKYNADSIKFLDRSNFSNDINSFKGVGSIRLQLIISNIFKEYLILYNVKQSILKFSLLSNFWCDKTNSFKFSQLFNPSKVLI